MDGSPLFDLNIYPYPATERFAAPGFMVFPPGGKVARGRENNLLVVYFTLAGQTAITVEGLHAWMEKKAEAFHKNPGTVTAGMRELIESVNLDLYQRNVRPTRQNSQVTMSLQVAVLKREMLYLANCGSGQSFLVGSDSVLQTRDAENAGSGLGTSQSVSIRFSQSFVAAGDYLLMSFTPLSNWTAETLSGGQTLSVEAFSRRLFGAARTPGKGVLIRFVEGAGKINYLHVPQGQPVAPQVEGTAEPAAVPVAPKEEPVQPRPDHAVEPLTQPAEPTPRALPVQNPKPGAGPV